MESSNLPKTKQLVNVGWHCDTSFHSITMKPGFLESSPLASQKQRIPGREYNEEGVMRNLL